MTTTLPAYPPATTPFRIPSSCFSQPKTAITNKPNLGDLELPVSLGASCLPPNSQFQSWYSPGMCMDQWTTIVSATQSSGQVVAACCPLGYTAQSRVGQVCASAFTTSSTVACLSDYNKSILPSGTCASTVISSGVAAVLPVFVAYRQQDLSLFPEGYTPGRQFVLAASSTGSASASSRSQTDGGLTTTGSLTPTSSSATDEGSELSTSAKIGIGLGVPLGVLLMAAVFFAGVILGRRRRARKQEQPNTAGEAWSKSEVHGMSRQPDELDGEGTAIHEMPSSGSERKRYSDDVKHDPRN